MKKNIVKYGMNDIIKHKDKKKFLKYFVIPTYGKLVRKQVDIVFKNLDVLKSIDKSAIIVANHSNTHDAIMAYIGFPFHVRWVASAALFRKAIPKFAIGYLADCIPKDQNRNDLITVREIHKALKKENVVGLFPEGTRTWDGESLDINPATAKMLKIFKYQVVIINFEGAYAIRPRWSDYKRKGPLFINVKRVISSDEIQRLTIKEIDDILVENLTVSHDAWQEENKIAYYHERGAEGIQKLLYLCPKCNSIHTIYGKNNEIICSACKNKDVLNPYLRLSGTFGYEKLHDWNKYQISKLGEINFLQEDCYYYSVEKDGKQEILSRKLKAQLFKDSIVLTFEDNTEKKFEFSEIVSMIIAVKHSLEIIYENTKYTFRLNKGLNMLKYQQMYEKYCKENKS